MSWILLSVLAAFVWALCNVTDKYLFSKSIKDPVLGIILFGLVGIVFSAIVFLTKGFGQISLNNILIALLNGLIYLLASLCYYRALQLEEVSRVIPLLYSD